MAARSEAQWRELIAQFEASGLTQKAFCKREGLSYDWFGRKRQRLLNSNAAERVDKAFARASLPVVCGGVIEVCGRDWVCRLPALTPAGYVAELLKAL